MATYSVSWKSRHELVYAEDGRTLRVEVEDGYDRPITEPMGRQHAKLWHLVVYEESIKHWDDGRLVAQGERDRIARNISVALTTAGTKHVIA